MGIFCRLIVVGALCSASAHALAAYSPYQLRSSVASGESFSIATPESIPSEKIEIRDYDIFFHPEIARLLLRIESTNGEAPLENFLTCPDELKSSPAGRNFCRAIERPETLFVGPTLFDPGLTGIYSAMQTLEENLTTIITPSERQGTTFSWFSESTSQKIRRAMLRLKFSEVERLASEIPTHDLSPLTTTLISQVREIEASGRRDYLLDARRISEKGKFRARLPHPNLSDEDRRVLSMFVYGMLWRFRGGGFVDEPKGTQLTRLYFALRPLDVIARLNGMRDSRFGFDQARRLIAQGWGRWFDMGRNPGQENEAHDLFYMTERGIYQMDGAAMMLEWAGFDSLPMKVLSRQFGICYLFAWERLPEIRVLPQLQPPFQGFFDSPTAWAELCAGTLIGLGLSEGLLGGRLRP